MEGLTLEMWWAAVRGIVGWWAVAWAVAIALLWLADQFAILKGGDDE